MPLSINLMVESSVDARTALPSLVCWTEVTGSIGVASAAIHPLHITASQRMKRSRTAQEVGADDSHSEIVDSDHSIHTSDNDVPSLHLQT